ncbi:MAG TPA: TadE/TadG family type IV pilus assembly protein [Acidobacteriaceae bacterium]|nr:TadE/TadG family type IV pilus assembly protein [Acidobacteriaceae bacterium]
MNRATAIHDFCRAELGETLIEFAISAVITMSLLLGAMDLARAFYTYHFISYAAQQGARFAEVHGSGWTSACNSQTGAGYPDQLGCTASQGDVRAYVQSLTPPAVTKANVTVTAQWPGKDISGNTTVCGTTSNYSGCEVRVTVSYQFTYMVPFLPSAAQTLSSTARAVIQQ